MKKNNNKKTLRYTVVFMLFIAFIITVLGVFYTNGGSAYDFINQYGDKVKMYGDGIYAHDSYFMATIFKGTDLAVLLIAIPLTILTLIKNVKKNGMHSHLFLTSIISFFLYYSSSIAFGVTYNQLHLLYIALFSISLFALIMSLMMIDYSDLEKRINPSMKYRGINIFLVLTGIALTIAWLPDIVTSLLNNKSLELIEVYTTQVTYVIDMGIISPLSFICLYFLSKRKGIGYSILTILLTVCTLVGLILPIQTIYQLNAGIIIPLPAVISKIMSFCILAMFAIYFNLKLYKNIKL